MNSRVAILVTAKLFDSNDSESANKSYEESGYPRKPNKIHRPSGCLLLLSQTVSPLVLNAAMIRRAGIYPFPFQAKSSANSRTYRASDLPQDVHLRLSLWNGFAEKDADPEIDGVSPSGFYPQRRKRKT
jgi:hypothetical protein